MLLDPLYPLPVIIVAAAVLAGLVVLAALRARAGRRLWPAVRRGLLVAALVGVALRPGVPGLGERVTVETGVDVLIVMDTTGSVVAEDWDGDRPRLEGMREDVAAITEEYAGSRFSLLTFDAAPVVRVPFTTDVTALRSAVEVLEPEVTTYSSGTSIGVAAPLVEQVLARTAQEHPERQQVVFYLGDGEQTDGSTPESFAAAARYVTGGAVLGYGTVDGGRMRENNGPFRDKDDEPRYIQDRTVLPSVEARSVIDEQALRQVAAQLGVEYLHREAGEPPALDAGDLPARPTSVQTQLRTVVELYWVPALAAFLLLLGEAAGIAVAFADLRRPRGTAS